MSARKEETVRIDRARAHALISTVPFGTVDRWPLQMLEEAGVEYALNPYGRILKELELADLVADFDVLIAGPEPITAAVMDRASRLKFISRATVGLDSVDLLAARERGFPVAYTPEANSQAVAELTVGLMLSLLRGVSMADSSLRRGEWVRVMGRCIGEVTVGIVGVGRIGKRVIRHLSGFGAKILANDIAPDEAFGAECGVGWAEKETIYREADVLSLHLPATPLTVDLISARELAIMKPGALLINTARGGIVNEAALAEALRSGRLGGAAIDVYREEPYAGELTQCANCLLTCHMGAMTRSSRLRMEIEAVENVICFLRGEPVPRMVPESEYGLQGMVARANHAGPD